MEPADYVNQQLKGIGEVFHNAAENYIKDYMKLGYIKFYETSEVSEIFNSTESMSGYAELTTHEAPPSLKLEDGYTITVQERRYGGALIVPEETYRRDGRDNTTKVDNFLDEQKNQLIVTATQKVITDAHAMLNGAFDGGSEYLAPDAAQLCGSHNWRSGATFNNQRIESFTETTPDTAEEYAGDFLDPSGKEMPLNFTDIVVKKGSASHREALKMYAKEIKPTKVGDVNIYEGSLNVVETSYITPTNRNNFFYFDLSKQRSPLAVGIGEYPTMRDPQKLENESIRSNVTDFRKQGVINMPYQILGYQAL